MFQNIPNDVKHVTSFKNVETSLKQCVQQNSYDCLLNVDSVQLKCNLKDEYLGVKKDLLFLDFYFNYKNNYTDFLKKLAVYHPIGVEKFMSEVDEVTNLFKNASGRVSPSVVTNGTTGVGETKRTVETVPYIDYFITDWDGTYKTYCSNYATCMQPTYSGVVLTKFVKKFTKFHAVLTAGPLRGPGILDLISVPESLINFGGSWGREWSLADEFKTKTLLTPVVESSCFTEGNQELFKKLTSEIETLLTTDRFAQFKRIGSGFQKKVDRLTIGIQNIIGEVPKETAESLIKVLQYT